MNDIFSRQIDYDSFHDESRLKLTDELTLVIHPFGTSTYQWSLEKTNKKDHYICTSTQWFKHKNEVYKHFKEFWQKIKEN